MNLNPIIKNDKIIVEVPEGYHNMELEFKSGGRIKRINKYEN